MNLILVIGAPGMGKSPFVRSLIGTDKRCCVFDVANEYGRRVKYSGLQALNLTDNTNDLRSRYTGIDLLKFVEICQKKKDTICIFEEATGFLQGKLQNKVTQLIINRYHSGNTYVFIFHSINSVPPRIMEMANIVALFRTNDEATTVMGKYRRIYPNFDELQNRPNGEMIIKKML